MRETAIEIKNLWKKYKIYQDKPATLKERFLFRTRGVAQEKWVLKDVSLSIPKGKMVGFIGRNGSGKSTLLKVMTGILRPDKGEISVEGKVSSLIELGAGFHMDFTGRENIYMNASIFGLTRREIDRRLESIIQFSELGNYIDNPVRTYSSGMFMRLAFSIAINVDPDILLIDEILAVGDNAFQKKCISQIEALKQQGKTIVLVSHDNGVMERLCDEIYWMDNAVMIKHGNPHEIIQEYLDFLTTSEEQRLQSEARQKEESAVPVERSAESTVENQGLDQTTEQKRWGNNAVVIQETSIINPLGENRFIFQKGQPIDIEIIYKVNQPDVQRPVFGIGIFKMDGTLCYGSNTYIDKVPVTLHETGKVVCRIESLSLVQGDYYVNVACHHEDGTPYDYITRALTFRIHSKEDDIGIAYIPHKWIIQGVKCHGTISDG